MHSLRASLTARWPLFAGATVFLLSLGLRLQAARQTHLVDDAFITYRYAAQIARGRGFVYNDGERVLGTTSPLLSLTLAAVGALGGDIPAAGLGLSIGASALCCALLFGIVRVSTGSGIAAMAGAALLAASGLQSFISGSGMETAAMGALMLGSYYLLVCQRPAAGATLAGLAALARPEGLAWVVAYLLVVPSRPGKRLAPALYALGPILAWAAFATAYFGSPVPQSAVAKVLQGQSVAPDLPASVLSLLTPLGNRQAALALCAGGVLLALREDRRLWAPLLFTLAFLAAYAGYRPMMYPWYPGPLDTAFCLVCAAVLGHALRLAGDDANRHRRSASVASLAVAVAIAVLLASRAATYPHTSRAPGLEPHLKLAVWLHEHTAPADTLLVGDVGYVGYYNLDRRVVDIYGLVWRAPESLMVRTMSPQLGAPWLAQAVAHVSPRAIALTSADSPEEPPAGYEFVEDAGTAGYRVMLRRPDAAGSAHGPIHSLESADDEAPRSASWLASAKLVRGAAQRAGAVFTRCRNGRLARDERAANGSLRAHQGRHVPRRAHLAQCSARARFLRPVQRPAGPRAVQPPA